MELIVGMFKRMAGVAQYLQIGVRVVAAIAVFVMDYQSAIGYAAPLATNSPLQGKSPVVPAPMRFDVLPVPVSVGSDLLGLEFVAARQRAGNRGLREQLAAHSARSSRATPAPVWIRRAVMPCGEPMSFARSINDTHTVTRAESPSTGANSGRPFIKHLAACLARTFNLRHSCSVSRMGYA